MRVGTPDREYGGQPQGRAFSSTVPDKCLALSSAPRPPAEGRPDRAPAGPTHQGRLKAKPPQPNHSKWTVHELTNSKVSKVKVGATRGRFRSLRSTAVVSPQLGLPPFSESSISSKRKMSKGRVFSRPRTKVYDTNYNIGESYYKPALDRLDRKYGGLPNGDTFSSLRSPPPTDLPSPRTALRDLEDDFFAETHRKRPNSAFFGDMDAIFEGRPPRRALDDDLQEDLSSSMNRLRAKASRSLAAEFEDIDTGFPKKESRMRARLDFGEKMMDSVGLTGRVRQALEEDGSTGRRRLARMGSDSGEAEELTRWTALKPGGMSRRSFLEEELQETTGVGAGAGAAARARKSRAMLDDIESEMAAISEKSLAREKRVRDLKALVQENEASALENLQTTMRVKSSIQSEKKTVTF